MKRTYLFVDNVGQLCTFHPFEFGWNMIRGVVVYPDPQIPPPAMRPGEVYYTTHVVHRINWAVRIAGIQTPVSLVYFAQGALQRVARCKAI